MKMALLALASVMLVAGCSDSPENNVGPATTPPVPVASQPTSGPSSQQQRDAAEAEQFLKMLHVPIYAGATVDATQQAASDSTSAHAVFTTPATFKQVEYFYNSYPELKPKSANGSTVYSGNLGGTPMVIEIRPGKGKTEIVVQARQS